MSLNHPKSGPNNVGAYQMSGIPFVTSSAETEALRADNANVHPIVVNFPFVTKNIKIRNIGGNKLRVAFTYSGSQTPGQGAKALGLTRNYFIIPPSDDAGNAGSDNSIVDFDVRCKSIFFTGEGGTTGFSLIAGLTPIAAADFPVLTGSNGFAGIG
jgi:hypothetical protein